MSNIQMDRRQLLKGLGVGALGAGAAVALAPTAALADEEDREGLLGSWNIAIHDANRPTNDGVASFAAGGVMATNDAGSPSTGLGVWKAQSGGKFAFTFTTFDFSQAGPGQPGTKVVISGKGTVKGDSIRGTFTVVVPGTPFTSHGTFEGTRMKV